MRTAEFIVRLLAGMNELATYKSKPLEMAGLVLVVGLAAGFVYMIHLIGKRL
jgi:hypothetical protein